MENAAAGMRSELPGDSAPGIGTGMRVLIADDVVDTVLTLGILLRSEGIDVRMVTDARRVVDEVRAFRPHAVLLDIGMPERHGYAIARELTQTLGGGCPVLVAVTARASDEDRRIARMSGFRYHVAKPYDLDVLLRLVISLRPPESRIPDTPDKGSHPG